jgi:hypothetical protein
MTYRRPKEKSPIYGKNNMKITDIIDKNSLESLEKERIRLGLDPGRMYALCCEQLGVSLESGKQEKGPIFNRETGELIKRFAGHFLGDSMKGAMYKEYMKATNGDEFKAGVLFIFMGMFPTASKDKNTLWEKHFKHNWTNVTLRRLTPMTLRNFNKIWNSKDIGIFLLGTYLFIQGCKNEGNGSYFIKNLENYFKEWKHWYQEAEEILQSGQLNGITQKQSKPKTNTTFF